MVLFAFVCLFVCWPNNFFSFIHLFSPFPHSFNNCEWFSNVIFLILLRLDSLSSFTTVSFVCIWVNDDDGDGYDDFNDDDDDDDRQLALRPNFVGSFIIIVFVFVVVELFFVLLSMLWKCKRKTNNNNTS